MGKPSLQRREAHPVLARKLLVRLHKALRSRTLMSLPEGIATPCMCLDSREAHPVLARQLRIRLHKALRSRTRGTENAHTLITH